MTITHDSQNRMAFQFIMTNLTLKIASAAGKWELQGRVMIIHEVVGTSDT